MNPRKTQIIVVEDENIVAMDLERSLKHLGYDVPVIASSGEEALQGVEKVLPDLILMDIQLKGEMNGIEAADKIRKLYNIPVIFLTAYADEPTLQKAKEAEPYGYLLKPFDEIELHTAIEVILKKHKSILEKVNLSEEQLAISEDRFKLFIEAVKDYAIYMLDISGNIISWNVGAARIKGYSAEEVIGKNFKLFYLPEDVEKGKPQQVLKQALTFGRCMDEGWRRRKDGTKFWAEVTVTAIYDKKGDLYGFGKVVHDLTKRKEEEDLLKKAIEARDEFLAIASHELKTPLTLLQLQTQIFQRNLKRDSENLFSKEKAEQLAEVTFKQVRKLTFLVEDMLDISRIQTGKFMLNWEQFNLQKLLQEIINQNKEQFIARGCGEPEYVYFSDNVMGTWDKMRVEQVITNLLNNALLYAKGHPIKISLKTQEKAVQIDVEDHGRGIANENLKKIFNRFERAVDYNEVSGLGLGLFISKQIVQGHGGKIWAESELNKGSTFHVTLPIAPLVDLGQKNSCLNAIRA